MKPNLTAILLLSFSLWLLAAGCGVQSKLTRNYQGKSFSLVLDRMGAPTRVEQLVRGGTMRIYEKRSVLKETPINTGQFQYDTFNAPKVVKTETTWFTVSQSGVVTNIKYQCDYGR